MNWNEMRWMNLNWIEMVWKMWLICEAVCRLAVDAGPCRDAYNRWYFDPERSTCVPFVFGGCAGNMNRFKNFESCINFCSAGIQDAERNQQHSRNGPFTSHLHIFFFTFSLFCLQSCNVATLHTHTQNRQQLKKFGNRFNCSFDWCSVAALLILHKNILRRLAMLSDYWCSVATLFLIPRTNGESDNAAIQLMQRCRASIITEDNFTTFGNAVSFQTDSNDRRQLTALYWCSVATL